MTVKGSHYSKIHKGRDWGTTLPSQPENGQEFIDNMNNMHYIYDSNEGGWWAAALTTSTSTSTTSTSSSTTSTSSSTSSSTSTTTSTSTSTTTTV